MIGMTLKVEMADGETFEAPITYGVACRWEDHHPTLSVGRFLEDMKFKPLAWLAWDALRTKKIVSRCLALGLRTSWILRLSQKPNRARRKSHKPDRAARCSDRHQSTGSDGNTSPDH
jgi:hypothetical protein